MLTVKADKKPKRMRPTEAPSNPACWNAAGMEKEAAPKIALVILIDACRVVCKLATGTPLKK